MIIVIPARFASSRLPGKPLLDVAGKTLLQRVYDCACRTRAQRIVIATDDARIEKAASGFGAEVCMTSPHHPSGTDRIAEVISKLNLADEEVVLNLQGDEPLMPAGLMDAVSASLEARPHTVMSTACHPVTDVDEFMNPNVVKVALTESGDALYFSRAPIPWPRDHLDSQGRPTVVHNAYRHIGLYAYRAGFVHRYADWPAVALEEVERLEQLRVLWHGQRVHVVVTDRAPVAGVDTEADLQRVRAWYSDGNDPFATES